MFIPFRQGVVYAPANFLQLSGNAVSLQIAIPDMVIATVADGASNYLINERVPVTNAWSGPFAPGPQSYWLYWDIHPITGVRTFGHTLYEPVEGSTAPASPVDDQHWFDTNVNKMKVWNALSTRWISKIRVFAAKLEAGAVLISMSVNSPLFAGTQVGSLASTPINAGPIIFDEDGQAVKRSTGAFFTTEDVAVVGVASGSQVKLGSVVVSAVAESTIPAFTIVRFTGFNRVALATNFNMSETNVYGMIEVDAVPGDVVNVTTGGIITNPLWDWTSVGVNTSIYVDNTGELTTTPPAIPLIVGTVVDTRSIMLRPAILTLSSPSSVTNPVQYQDEGVDIGTPSVVTDVNFVGAGVTATYGAGTVTVTIPGIVDPTIFTYTATQAMLSTHARNVVEFDAAAGVNYSIPANATLPLPVGTTVVVSQIGVGQVTIDPAVGVTVRTPETLITRKQFAKVTLIKTATNTWDLEGNLEPV